MHSRHSKHKTTYHGADLEKDMDWGLVRVTNSYSTAHNVACMVNGVINAACVKCTKISTLRAHHGNLGSESK